MFLRPHFVKTRNNDRRATTPNRIRRRLWLQNLEQRVTPTVFPVTNLADLGPGSLRQAIIDANTNPGADIVDATGVSGTITLATQLDDVIDDVTINGPGAGALSVSGGGTVGILKLAGTGTTSLTIAGLTLTLGKATGAGGAVNVTAGSLTINDSVISNCTSTGNAGAINLTSISSLKVSNSTISGNSSGSAGGAIYSAGGAGVIIQITNSTLSGNKAVNSGGAILLTGAGAVTIGQSTISGNQAGLNGGGIRTYGGFSGTLDVTNSTVSKNTLTGTGVGRGLSRNGGVFNVTSTIVAQNTGGSATTGDLSGTVNLNVNFSLIGVADGATITGANNIKGTNATPVDAKLSALGNNGGPTATHLPGLTSPALDVGSNPGGLTTDQRGKARVIGSGIDIGSVELDPNIPSASAAFVNVTAAGATTYALSVTYSDKTAIKVSTLDSSDIRVTGPGGFNVLATFKSATPNADAASIVGSYEFTPPGGSWDLPDNGTYTVSLEPSQVTNTTATAVPDGALGTFKVLVPDSFLVNTSVNDEVVDTDGKMSLREALAAANASAGLPSSISFDPIVFAGTQTITLGLGELAITDSLTITGPAGGVIVDAALASRVLNLNIGGVGDVAISNMTLTNGNVTGTGGGVFAGDDNFSLTNGAITNCVASGPGGGIGNSGAAGKWTLTNSSLTGNQAGGSGGGIYFFTTGALVVTNSAITGNMAKGGTGGGIYNFSNSASIVNSTISGNTASGAGGGIHNNSTATVTIQNSTIANNVSGGAGGGVNRGSATSLSIESTIIDGNTATGTGPDVNGAVTLNFSQISNSAGATITGANNLLNVSAKLLPLALNGGTTLNHLPGAGSPVRNAGSNPGSLTVDQRGLARVLEAKIDIGSTESTDPTPIATGSSPDVTVAGGTTQTITVTYTDNNAIDVSTLDSGDITVVGPGGSLPVVFKSAVPNTNGTPIVATYELVPPGGSWDGSDSGSYAININAGQVFDTDTPTKNSVLPGTVGSFQVKLPTTFVVDATNDESVDTDGKTSLREALLKANSNAGLNDTITFDAMVFAGSQTITLALGELAITDSVTVIGPIGGVVVDATGASRVMNLNVPGTGNVVLSKITLTNGNVTGTGGGVFAGDDNFSLTDGAITNCTSTDSGGGIGNSGSGGTWTFVNSTISGNSAGGNGGGIYWFTSGKLILTSSALTGNTAAADGGGVYNFSNSALIVNSTISGNSTTGGNGGGIQNTSSAVVTIQNSTIANNSATGDGGGINKGSGTVSIESTIVDGNTASGLGPDINGAVTAKFSLVGNTTDATITGSGNLLGVTANLQPLALNGGTTENHLPGAGSPVRNAGSNPAGLTLDQRGLARVQQGFIDMGSVESSDPAPLAKGSAPNVNAVGATTHTITVTYTDDVGINVNTLGSANLVVNPGAIPVVFKGAVPNTNGSPIVATYEMVPPGGSWDIADNGVYTITMNAGQVFDIDSTPNAVNAGSIGTFTVAVPEFIVVNATNDETTDTDGKTSLREAVALANGSINAAVQITFDPVVFASAQTIVLTLGELAPTRSMDFVGPAAGVTVDGNANGRILNLGATGTGDFALSNMTLTNGKATTGAGGAVFAGDDNFSLTNGAITKSIAAAGPGGGIGNSGAGGTWTFTNSTISGNSASGNGGGVYWFTSGTLVMTGCTVSGNTAGGTGGGIYNFSNTANIVNSTISGNKSGIGGGGGGSGGGGIQMNSGCNVNISNSTITGNDGTAAGGIYRANGTLTLSSTIVAGNMRGGSATSDGADLKAGAAISVAGNNNLIGVMDAANNITLTGTDNLTGTTATPLDAKLGALADNGGPTQTHALLSGSPAINKGNNAAGLTTDQRGISRVIGSAADIGAYELQAAPPTVTSFVINGGALQRSNVTTIEITFSEAVTLGAGAFSLDRVGLPTGATTDGNVLGSVNLNVAQAGNLVTITFTGGGVAGVRAGTNALLDGKYTLVMNASKIAGSGGQLDGDGNGTGGDNRTDTIRALFGDGDGDGDVDVQDFSLFRAAFSGGPSSVFDYEGDGDVDLQDFSQFRGRFSLNVP